MNLLNPFVPLALVLLNMLKRLVRDARWLAVLRELKPILLMLAVPVRMEVEGSFIPLDALPTECTEADACIADAP